MNTAFKKIFDYINLIYLQTKRTIREYMLIREVISISKVIRMKQHLEFPNKRVHILLLNCFYGNLLV